MFYVVPDVAADSFVASKMMRFDALPDQRDRGDIPALPVNSDVHAMREDSLTKMSHGLPTNLTGHADMKAAGGCSKELRDGLEVKPM